MQRLFLFYDTIDSVKVQIVDAVYSLPLVTRADLSL